MANKLNDVKRVALPTLLLLCISIVASGCWSAREMDELSFIMAVGVDAAEEGRSGYVVSFRVANPSLLAGGETGGVQGGIAQQGETTVSVIIEANSMLEAMDRFRERVPRRPYLSHVQVIMIGEDLARQGIAEVTDFFERDTEVRRLVPVLVVKEISAADFFTMANPTLVTASGIAVDGLLRQAPLSAHAPVARLGDVVEQIGSARKDAFAGAVSLVPASPSGSHVPLKPNLSGTALFQDDRFVGYLNENETAVFMAVRNEVGRMSVSLRDAESGLNVDARLHHLRTSVRLVDGDSLRFRVDLRFEGAIQQAHNVGGIDGEHLLERAAREFETHVEARTRAMIRRTQSLGSDAIGFGEILYRSHPAIWRRVGGSWDVYFPTIEVDVHVVVTLVSTGNVIRGVQIPTRDRDSEVPALGGGISR